MFSKTKTTNKTTNKTLAKGLQTHTHANYKSYTVDNPKYVNIDFYQCWGYENPIKTTEFHNKIQLLLSFIDEEREDKNYRDRIKYNRFRIFISVNPDNPEWVAEWNKNTKTIVDLAKSKGCQFINIEEWQKTSEGINALARAEEKLEAYFNEKNTRSDLQSKIDERRPTYDRKTMEDAERFVSNNPKKSLTPAEHLEASKKHVHTENLHFMSCSMNVQSTNSSSFSKRNHLHTKDNPLTIMIANHKAPNSAEFLMKECEQIGYQNSLIYYESKNLSTRKISPPITIPGQEEKVKVEQQPTLLVQNALLVQERKSHQEKMELPAGHSGSSDDSSSSSSNEDSPGNTPPTNSSNVNDHNSFLQNEPIGSTINTMTTTRTPQKLSNSNGGPYSPDISKVKTEKSPVSESPIAVITPLTQGGRNSNKILSDSNSSALKDNDVALVEIQSTPYMSAISDTTNQMEDVIRKLNIAKQPKEESNNQEPSNNNRREKKRMVQKSRSTSELQCSTSELSNRNSSNKQFQHNITPDTQSHSFSQGSEINSDSYAVMFIHLASRISQSAAQGMTAANLTAGVSRDEITRQNAEFVAETTKSVFDKLLNSGLMHQASFLVYSGPGVQMGSKLFDQKKNNAPNTNEHQQQPSPNNQKHV